MKIVMILFLISPLYDLNANVSKELEKSLDEYFIKIKQQYEGRKNWNSKLKIYSVLFIEFSDLIKSNLVQEKNISNWYYLGLSSGFLDLTYSLSYLEDGLYEGEWVKSAGIALKEQDLRIYNEMMNLTGSNKMEYYALEIHERQKKTETIFMKLIQLLEKTIKNQKSDEKKVFLSGYLNSYIFFFSLNQFLDNQIKKEMFINHTIKILKP